MSDEKNTKKKKEQEAKKERTDPQKAAALGKTSSAVQGYLHENGLD